MFNNNKILVVIPAKGGSRGIPRKNVRLLNNKPLIYYSIATAKASEYVDDIVVTTDDDEVTWISEKFGVSVVRRSMDLSTDEVTLEPVVYDAVNQKEKLAFDEYDIVITIEPTSPLIKPKTLDQAIEKFEDFSVDSVISVIDDRHLNWGYDESNQRYFPQYIERLNEEFLPKSYKETGAILASRRSFIHEDSCLGTSIALIELSREESVSIKDYPDWWVAENYLQRKKVAIVVDAYDEIGTGHLYRCMSIASKLVMHDVLFLLDESHKYGINILKNYNYPCIIHDGLDDVILKLRDYNPHIVINDILDTNSDYILNLKNQGYFVVNFEDLGPGSEFADVVFDDLYEHGLSGKNVFTGYKYYILRDEFYFQPKKVITNNVNNVLIAFGGTDPNNFTEKVINAILATNYEGRVNVILGAGYPDKEGLVSKIESNPAIQVYSNVDNIGEFMFKADIIFTSGGHMIYDICSLGIPTICLCQNEREERHVFCSNANGFINMGLGVNVSMEKLITQFIDLVNNHEQRIEMNQRMSSIDLKNGFDNVGFIIKQKYREFKLKQR